MGYREQRVRKVAEELLQETGNAVDIVVERLRTAEIDG